MVSYLQVRERLTSDLETSSLTSFYKSEFVSAPIKKRGLRNRTSFFYRSIVFYFIPGEFLTVYTFPDIYYIVFYAYHSYQFSVLEYRLAEHWFEFLMDHHLSLIHI